MIIPNHFRSAYSGFIDLLHSLHIKCCCGLVCVWLTQLHVYAMAEMSLEEVREYEKQLQQETNQKMKNDMSDSGSISNQEKKDLGRGSD